MINLMDEIAVGAEGSCANESFMRPDLLGSLLFRLRVEPTRARGATFQPCGFGILLS